MQDAMGKKELRMALPIYHILQCVSQEQMYTYIYLFTMSDTRC